MPFVDVSLVHLLYSQYAGEEAVVPLHDDDGVASTSPLAARGQAAVHSVLDRLRVRFVPMQDGSMLRSINTPADYQRYCHAQVVQ